MSSYRYLQHIVTSWTVVWQCLNICNCHTPECHLHSHSQPNRDSQWHWTDQSCTAWTAVYTVSRNGLSINPCGAPLMSVNNVELSELHLTRCTRPVRYDFSQLITDWARPKWDFGAKCHGSQSKAELRSNSAMSETFPESAASIKSDWIPYAIMLSHTSDQPYMLIDNPAGGYESPCTQLSVWRLLAQGVLI